MVCRKKIIARSFFIEPVIYYRKFKWVKFQFDFDISEAEVLKYKKYCRVTYCSREKTRKVQSEIKMGAGASKGDQTPPRRLSLSKSPARGYPNSQQQQKRPIRQNNGYDSRSPSPPSIR